MTMIKILFEENQKFDLKLRKEILGNKMIYIILLRPRHFILDLA